MVTFVNNVLPGHLVCTFIHKPAALALFLTKLISTTIKRNCKTFVLIISLRYPIREITPLMYFKQKQLILNPIISRIIIPG